MLKIAGSSKDFEIGSLSAVTHKKLTGYETLPDWTDDPTDSSLREFEVRLMRLQDQCRY